ncbi:uracil-DNA glycosylase [Thioalkalivibrio sp. XN8]|uniref:uracil-DNA glycosylase n=1 Tax=Thioalkalivibrio sp. XN8 TaxID=2712863 RepID=UPI0013E9FD65|nr:uracil-DNA glycosylase [Thioalkalivibrio sp. XN8]NGP51914.1 uracil-DNA glycosylase [Thioalkalivibrio sp. XN8]
MDPRRLECLHALGLPAWAPRPGAILPGAPEAWRVPAVPAEAPAQPAVDDAAGLDWEALEARVSACTLCPLHAGRTRTVFGVGNRRADLLVIGEAPGAEEDRRGEPFVGRAGKLLDAMLLALGHDRSEVYIANVVKCRPPQNRDPRPEEAASCAPYLDRQVALLQPRVILAVGRVAAQRLLDTEAPVGRLRGRIHSYGPAETPLVVTWHPAYLLRRPEAKAEAWRDLVLAAEAAGAGR